jgi:hypothetical protein
MVGQTAHRLVYLVSFGGSEAEMRLSTVITSLT